MRTDSPPVIKLKNYRQTPFIVDHVDLDVRLHETETRVHSKLVLRPRKGAKGPLELDGVGLTLHAISLNGVPVDEKDYRYKAHKLTLKNVPRKAFSLEIVQSCNPQANTALSGLYLSNAMFCTQMEAEGFRRFAFHYDRPDVMATYRVRVEAAMSLPVLLSNGNPVKRGRVGADRHYAIWADPHPKPSYLFALVAGDLACVHSKFVTNEGRKVKLGIYVEKGKEDRCDWAMECLKASMRWDEQRFGLAYDLDEFNIVAVSDFNMGAMENKGLNIFNDKYILARPDTATDVDFALIEGIIAHEYFHNWTGNRITCRDWFQLCLKEGLTVFRDQEFTSDTRSRAVKRINDVKTLRARQFPEDQGPLSHPVRPSSYIEINNFYTPTIYEKGAELCRMLLTLMGPQKFRKAMDLYFKRHDGEAATIEDFVACMAQASKLNLKPFFNWYLQAGTPKVSAKLVHDVKRKTATLQLSQTTPALLGQKAKKPLPMPLRLGLVGADGKDLALILKTKGAVRQGFISFTKAKQDFVFINIAQRPRLSLNRGFSAPIVLETNASPDDLLFLLAHDSDNFNRWEAAQTLGRGFILSTMRALAEKRAVPTTKPYAEALRRVLKDSSLDPAFKALMLQLPPEAEIAGSSGGNADADLVVEARELVRREIATVLQEQLIGVLNSTPEIGPYRPDVEGASRRSLRFTALALLAAISPDAAFKIAEEEFATARNMTSVTGAIFSTMTLADPRREAMIDAFHQRYRHDHLLLDKWFLMQATIPGAQSGVRVRQLMAHPDFNFGTPNRVYALVGGFSGGNLAGFNAKSGEGYAVVADAILTLDGRNPQVAARMATGFRSWKLFDAPRRAVAEEHMRRILAKPDLSRDVMEIVSRTVNG